MLPCYCSKITIGHSPTTMGGATIHLSVGKLQNVHTVYIHVQCMYMYIVLVCDSITHNISPIMFECEHSELL